MVGKLVMDSNHMCTLLSAGLRDRLGLLAVSYAEVRGFFFSPAFCNLPLV